MESPTPLSADELLQRLPSANAIRREIAELEARRNALMALLRAAIRAERGRGTHEVPRA